MTGTEVGIRGIATGGESGPVAGVHGLGGVGVLGEAQEISTAVPVTGAGVQGVGRSGDFRGPGVVGQGGSAGGSGEPGVVGFAGAGDGDGVRGFGSGSFSGVAGFGHDGTGGTGVVGFGGANGLGLPVGPGVKGVAAGAFSVGDPGHNPFDPVGVFGIGGGGQGGGVSGISLNENGNGVVGEANNGSAAFAVWGKSASGFAGVFDGKVQINGDLTVNGVKQALVALSDGTHRALYCLESPESWFEDFGFGQLVNGQAQVRLDPIFASVVETDDYHVFLTE